MSWIRVFYFIVGAFIGSSVGLLWLEPKECAGIFVSVSMGNFIVEFFSTIFKRKQNAVSEFKLDTKEFEEYVAKFREKYRIASRWASFYAIAFFITAAFLIAILLLLF